MIIKKKDSFLYIKPLLPYQLKQTIVYLGASFIKLAQVLATRSDFFDTEYLVELKELHDKLPSMKEKEFTKVFEKAFPKNIFQNFEKSPIASASIGQVHIGYLEDGTKFVDPLQVASASTVQRYEYTKEFFYNFDMDDTRRNATFLPS